MPASVLLPTQLRVTRACKVYPLWSGGRAGLRHDIHASYHATHSTPVYKKKKTPVYIRSTWYEFLIFINCLILWNTSSVRPIHRSKRPQASPMCHHFLQIKISVSSSYWKEIFLFPETSRLSMGLTQRPIQYVSGFFHGVLAAGEGGGWWNWPLTCSSTEV